MAALSKVWVCGRLLSWDCRFESRRGHGYLSLVNFLCFYVEVSATGRSLVQRISTEFVSLSVWSGATVTLGTYNDLVEEVRIRKKHIASNNYAITILYQSCFTPEVQDTLSSTHRTVKPFSHMIRQYTSYDGMKLQDDHAYTLKKCYTHILCCNLIMETSHNVVSITNV
jgi:hypothetical protein